MMVVKIKSNLRHIQDFNTFSSFAKIEEESILVIVWLFDFPKRFWISLRDPWQKMISLLEQKVKKITINWLDCYHCHTLIFAWQHYILHSWAYPRSRRPGWRQREEKNGYVTDSWSGLSIEMTLAGIHRYSTRKRNTILTRSPWGESWHKIYT